MTVGQEFYGYADALEGEISLLRDAEKYLYPGQHGRDRNRYRNQRTEGISRKMRSASCRTDRQAHHTNIGHDLRNVGSAGLCGLFRGIEEPGHKAFENFQ